MSQENVDALVERDIGALQAVCNSYPELVDERVGTLLADDRFTDSDKAAVRRFLAAEDGAFAPRIEAIASEIQRGVPVERAELPQKLGPLRQGGRVATDISDEMSCALLGAATVGVLVTAPPGIGLAWAAVGLYAIATQCA